MIKRSKGKSFILTFFIFASLFVNEDVLVFGTITNTNMISFRMGLQVVITALMLGYVVYNGIPLLKSKLRIFTIFLFFFLISMIVNMDLRSGYIFLIMIYLNCMLITTIYNFDEIYTFFVRIMYAVCIASLIIFSIQIIAPNILNIFPMIENVNGLKFHFIGLTNAPLTYGSFIRNWGPFRESGVFQAYIIVALVYVLFSNKKSGIKKPLVFIIALITTFSTTGYIAFFLILFATVVIKKDEVSKNQRRMIYAIFFISISGLLYLTFFTDLMFKYGYGSVFGKLFGTYESSSYHARLASITVNVKMFMENPIFGKGITYVDEMFKSISGSLYGVELMHNTNMLFIQLSKYGLATFVFTIYRYVKSFKESYNLGMFVWITISLAYFVLMFGENFSYSIVMTLPIFFIVSDKNR